MLNRNVDIYVPQCFDAVDWQPGSAASMYKYYIAIKGFYFEDLSVILKYKKTLNDILHHLTVFKF